MAILLLKIMSSISSTSLPTPQARPGVPAHPRADPRIDAGVERSSSVDLTPRSSLGANQRPIRINRFPEEEALFAYNRQAQINVHKAPSKIDEYV